jgi:hypothetical protein
MVTGIGGAVALIDNADKGVRDQTNGYKLLYKNKN